MITLSEVREKSTKGRFFNYSWGVDSLLAQVSIYPTWVLLNLRCDALTVSWLSGLMAIIGGVCIAMHEPLSGLIGAIFYFIYFLLDYCDGAVARFWGTSGTSGQYIDWIMHALSALAISVGLSIAALSESGPFIAPFAILTILAVSLSLSRYSLAWFSICMARQQFQTTTGPANRTQGSRPKNNSHKGVYYYIKALTTLVFHENFLVFSLLVLSFADILIFKGDLPYASMIVIFGGLVYFPVIAIEITRLAKSDVIDNACVNLFDEEYVPNLPNEHFFK